MEYEYINIGQFLLDHFSTLWTFLLLMVRFVGMMTIVPGLGSGAQGLQIRLGAIISLSLASLVTSPIAELPEDFGWLIFQVVSEFSLGLAVGFIPALLTAGAQTAGQLSATTMGLGASQLFDPTTGTSVSGLSKLFGDIVVVVFMLTSGHHVVIKALSGLGGELVPGTFFIGATTLDLLIDRTAHVFYAGAMISAPVIVALLLTQFVMGLITKAVPTVNIFIVSFPLTIGIGLVLSALSLPDLVVLIQRDIVAMEHSILVLLEDVAREL